MNVFSRGVRGALRTPVRSGALVIILAISLGLILAMLVARESVEAKISDVKATTATELTINPAGISGGFGSGDALQADQVAAVTKTPHVTNVTAELTDQLGEGDTNLASSLELGGFGKRQLRFEERSLDATNGAMPEAKQTFTPKPRIITTGTTQVTAAITSGSTINAASSDLVALVGKTLAEKNNLAPGSTFTAYGQTITVKGVFSSGNRFSDSGIIVPLTTLQNLTNQPGAVSHINAKVDSSDNVASTIAKLKTALGDKADIVSQQDQAENSLKPLEGISNLALSSVIGASIASLIIVVFLMIIMVRERRREIGVVKAIGGTNAKIIIQFMTEAMTLTVIGGIVGIGLGIAASGPMTQSLVNNSADQTAMNPRGGLGVQRQFGAFSAQVGRNIQAVSTTLTPQTITLSAGIILLIAGTGSAIPAWLIARVRPAEVLRSE